jgi:Protein of unknown function (DUF3237)
MTPELRFVLEVRASVGQPLNLGGTRRGHRRALPITGGTVSGPRLQGEVVAGGSDWQLVQADGMIELVARYFLRDADDTLIAVTNRAIFRAPPEILAKLRAGEAVDPTLYYFRGVPTLEAPSGPHEWVNRSIFIATGQREAGQVLIRFSEVP